MVGDMNLELRSLNPDVARQRRQIEQFLHECGLRYDDVDTYDVLADESTGEIVAGGGLRRGIIKCIAVAEACRGESVANRIVSHLIARANADGYQCVKLYTKPANRRLFESLSFRMLAEAPEAILMETGIGGIETVKRQLAKMSERLRSNDSNSSESVAIPDGAIVMNCNPFTLGHRYLIEQSSKQVRRLYVVVVKEDCSQFSYEERKAMVEAGVKDLGNVVVVGGSDYSVSATTFPTYFLKRLSDASDTQMLLDLDLYRRHIAPALGSRVRFVGSEPNDALTLRYNQLMAAVLQDVRQVERLVVDGAPVSASRVRKALVENRFIDAARLVPATTLPYIIAHLATCALKAELNTTPKPGLVDCRDSGAHRDMDHELMMRSIRALQPYFVRLASLGFAADTLPPHNAVVEIGLEAERAMFAATGGVNTHKGALFSMGLAVVAAAMCCGYGARNAVEGRSVASEISRHISALASRFAAASGTHGSEVCSRSNMKGALDNAREGYAQLFEEWLPFYESRLKSGDSYLLHRTLLRIMCDLDDTNIAYRTSYATMQRVKADARLLLEDFSEGKLEQMNNAFIRQNISPGGSADMLSLVVFLHAVVRKQ